MDEILIEEKRYISSKQAAKITGYAKDYIGQLCREGRVTARLVGRSWYVLEAAIQDHRFGAPAIEAMEKVAPKAEDKPSLAAHHSKPTYSEIREEVLPTVNELAYAPTARSEESDDAQDAVMPLQDSWRSWFGRVEDSAIEGATPVLEPQEAPEEHPVVEESLEENVPVRAIHHTLYKPVEEESLPMISKTYAAPSRKEILEEESILGKQAHERKERSYLVSGIQMGSIFVGAVAVVLALIGSGYLDTYVLSNKQVSSMAGVAVYNK